jgi:hypothetical protein
MRLLRSFFLAMLVLIPSVAAAQTSEMTVIRFKAHVSGLEASTLPMFSSDGKAVQEVFRAAIREERDPTRRSPNTCLPERVTAAQSMELLRYMKTVPASRNQNLAIAVIREWFATRFRCGASTR